MFFFTYCKFDCGILKPEKIISYFFQLILIREQQFEKQVNVNLDIRIRVSIIFLLFLWIKIYKFWPLIFEVANNWNLDQGQSPRNNLVISDWIFIFSEIFYFFLLIKYLIAITGWKCIWIFALVEFIFFGL